MRDQETTIHTLKEVVDNFCLERNWDQFHSSKELAIGLITESSELLEIFRFKTEEEVNDIIKNPVKRTLISEELSDILFFILRFGQLYDFDLATAFEQKMKKNELNYPVEKCKNKNFKYSEY
ncbi:nucleotide pyrophosphohydrolase [Spartinivicinus ruber]|uniref:nucleotide pyrophosphohydrolase n=1 Tax=Spartinivicinus ruber TaxID=2683272 RepID=UPI0013D51AEA|nr:nucleotide pyrophosphohydrolase [Spartinivicinus ruber]